MLQALLNYSRRRSLAAAKVFSMDATVATVAGFPLPFFAK